MFFDWRDHSGWQATRLETVCLESYYRHLKSPSVRATIQDAEASGWDEPRIVAELHQALWPVVVREAVETLGPSDRQVAMRDLTDTPEGVAVAERSATGAFARLGYDESTVRQAIRDATRPRGKESNPTRGWWS